MPLSELWQRYRTQGYAAVRDAPCETALACFYLALLAHGEEDYPRAAAWARQASRREPGSRVYEQGAAYLDRVVAQGKAGVYVDGEAFAAFIRGGGNVGLYDAISVALHQVYEEYETLSLLDVGVGDGLALLPALTSNIIRLDLVEPSGAMLQHTTAALDKIPVNYRAFQGTIQEFMRLENGQEWDVIQATWSLQSIPPAERPAIFGWLRAHGQRTVIAEFDVPEFDSLYAPERVQTILDRYWNGLAEYTDDANLVAQGFLMPVMFGCFDRTAERTNYENRIQTWVDGLRAAGFEQVEARLLYPYWWADAYVIDAR